MSKRFRFVAVFEGDLDMVPGAMHSEADWQRLAIGQFLRQTHYNTSAKVIESTDARDHFGGWINNEDGWVSTVGYDLPRGMDADTPIQFRTEEMQAGYYFAEWHPAKTVFTENREATPGSRVSHYRTRKENTADPVTNTYIGAGDGLAHCKDCGLVTCACKTYESTTDSPDRYVIFEEGSGKWLAADADLVNQLGELPKTDPSEGITTKRVKTLIRFSSNKYEATQMESEKAAYDFIHALHIIAEPGEFRVRRKD